MTDPLGGGAALVAEARQFAKIAHAKQPYGDHPYMYHLDAVAAIVRDQGPLFEAAAYLHDTVEDVPDVDVDTIAGKFGPLLAQVVHNLTDPDATNRRERKRLSNQKLANCHCPISLTVKAADRLANLRECVATGRLDKGRMYVTEHDAFRAATKRAWVSPKIWTEIEELIQQLRTSLAGTD